MLYKNNYNQNEFPQKRPQHNSNFQQLIEIAAAKLGMNREFKAIKVCQAARQSLAALFPSQSQNYQVQSFQNGILKITANSAPAMQQLFTRQHQLIEELSQKTGEKISQIKITN
ncbi:DUF721 domain-containing protein [Candidatus Peregrinibacteria bacterium]|nr:DUF721 domain-containing protein [Candidatus Peregrinibacteria bacterium]